ncbi:hypothetical protein CQA38_00900 [Campylobacter sp. MIT 12-5580]|uniref:hypothetical protein n=1 Tax=Campylobacter sp. MIT 12-5580 TaxID=2040651 RepID=UPI0010F8EC6F|nr:hypothetical protein [Campylobacter sp. MIT 12-5580]TKX30231.1 hypothetical protein CQA38_00900 [Campylobacter sp. MIT 12-5580]
MFRAVEDSIKHFFEEILKGKLTQREHIEGELYGAAIMLKSEIEGEFNFYLFFSKEVFEHFRLVFLQNVTFHEGDFCDLAKECANEIIGYAKMKLNEKGGDYVLGIPEYLGRVDFENFKLDRALTFDLNGALLRVGYKKI